MAIGLVDRIEKAYGVEVPERYRKFIESGEHAKHPLIELSGYIRGPYKLDFTDDLLVDVNALGFNAGIDDMDDVPWDEEFATWVPLASLSHENVPEPKMFLALEVESEAVGLFHQEGWKMCAVNKSFDDFLKELPKATSSLRSGNEDDDDEE